MAPDGWVRELVKVSVLSKLEKDELHKTVGGGRGGKGRPTRLLRFLQRSGVRYPGDH